MLKSKKDLRDKEREIQRLNEQLRASKTVIEDQRHKLEEVSRKTTGHHHHHHVSSQSMLNSSSQGARPVTASQQNNPLNNSTLLQSSQQLKQDLQERESQVKELKSVIDQLEVKMNDRVAELDRETADKIRFKDKYEEAQLKVARLEA